MMKIQVFSMYWQTKTALCLSVAFTLAGCLSTYQKGIDTAGQLIDEVGAGSGGVGRESIQQIEFGVDYQSTAFGRRVKEAVLGYPALSSQSARIAGSEARLDALRGSLRPQLSYGIAAGQDLIDSTNDTGADAIVTVRQLVFDGAATQNRIASAQIAQRMLQFELDVLLSSLSRQMAAAELGVWRQKELLILAEQDVATHRSFVEQNRTRAAGGMIAESDLLSANSRLSDSIARLAQASSALARAEANYETLIGPVPTIIMRPPSPPVMAAETARSRVLTGAQTAIARLEIANAESLFRIARSERYPGVYLELSGGRTDLFGSNADTETFAGFSIDQSLYQGGQQRARERERRSSVAAAKSNLETTERQLKQALEVALANRANIAAEIDTAKEASRLNQENLDATQEQFQIGRRDITDILDAQRDLVIAKSRVITLEANRIETEFQVLESTGDLAALFGLNQGTYPKNNLGEATTD